MSATVVAVTTSAEEAERILTELKEQGFRSQNISIMLPNPKGGLEPVSPEQTTKAPEGAAAGLTTGLVGGGILGWLAGVGSLALPGIGPLLAAGPLVAALTGAAVGGAVGGLAGGLIGLGLNEDQANIYLGKMQRGDSLVAVSCDSLSRHRKQKNSSRKSALKTCRTSLEQTNEKSPEHTGGRTARLCLLLP